MSLLGTDTAVFSPAERISYAENGIINDQIIKSSSGNVTLFAFDEGQELKEHTAPFDVVLHVVEGQAQITIEGNLHSLTTGQMIILPANISHAVAATTAFKMLLIMIKDKK